MHEIVLLFNSGNFRIPQLSCNRSGDNPSNSRTVIFSITWSRILSNSLSGCTSTRSLIGTFLPCCTPIFLALRVFFGLGYSSLLSDSFSSSCGSGELYGLPADSGDTSINISSSSPVSDLLLAWGYDTSLACLFLIASLAATVMESTMSSTILFASTHP